MSDVSTSDAPHHNGSAPLDQLPVLDPASAPVLHMAVRPRSSMWDRSKILLGLIALWWILLWGDLANNPIESFRTAFALQVPSLWWLEGLIGLEVLRQLHYLLSEHSPRWHRLWTEHLFGRIGRLAGRTSDWNRYRVGRVVRVLVVLAVLALILGAFFHTSPVLSLFLVPSALFSALPFILQLAFAFFFIVFQFVGMFWFLSRGGIDVYFPGDIRTRFADVWGQDAVLERVKENIIFLKEPEAIEERGGYVPGGILLWGPPGTGKTLIAEAVAGETQNPFVFVDPGAFINMFLGIGVLKVKSLFRKLRKLAVRYGGVVVFLDEADSLGNRGALALGGIFGPKPATPWSHDGCRGLNYLSGDGATTVLRDTLPHATEAPAPRRWGMMMGGMMGGGGTGTLQSLLAELSGLKKPRGFMNRVVRRVLGLQPKQPPKYRILVMMATNMPESLDEALLRPGRIDRIYKVGYPSKAGRIRTYEGYFSRVRHNLTAEDVDRLATVTPYATGATIKDLVNESLINAIRDGREVIEWRDVIQAKQRKELGPPEDVEYIERERHAVAVHEACHAVVAAKLQRDHVIDLATIEKGGTYLGLVKPVRVEDTFTRWKSDYEADIMVSLASLAGERLFFEGDNSSGVSGDLESATIIASYMEGYWGMGRTVSSVGAQRELGGGGPGGNGRDRREEPTLPGMSMRVESKLGELLTKTREVLERHRFDVLALAHALESHKTITGEDVHAILNGTVGPLVDGRRYRSDHFRELVEHYHHEIVSAHKARSHPDVRLPELPQLEVATTVAEPA